MIDLNEERCVDCIEGLEALYELVSQKGTSVPDLPGFFCLGRVRRLSDGLIQRLAFLRRQRQLGPQR